jgi:hypothetical protein
MKAALAITGLGLVDPLPVEEIAQCVAVFGIAILKFCDPVRCEFDPAYTEVFVPALPPSLPRVTAAGAKNIVKGRVPDSVIEALDAAIQQHAWMNSLGAAMLKTVFRTYSAKTRGDRAAERRQKEQQERLCADVKARQKEVTRAWRRLLAEIERANVRVGSITPAQFVRFQKRVWAEGFPPLETKLLSEWGLGERDIHWLQVLAGVIPPPRRPVRFTEMVESLIAINERYSTCECSCRE